MILFFFLSLSNRRRENDKKIKYKFFFSRDYSARQEKTKPNQPDVMDKLCGSPDRMAHEISPSLTKNYSRLCIQKCNLCTK
jgi:hypothetical protein